MNNSRRKRINQSILALTGAQERMQKALDEEKAALARIPNDDDNEEMRDGMEEIISGLEDALSSLEEALDTLNGADF
jgi:exonuclease VII small subunit